MLYVLQIVEALLEESSHVHEKIFSDGSQTEDDLLKQDWV
jgi:hypothetical protein